MKHKNKHTREFAMNVLMNSPYADAKCDLQKLDDDTLEKIATSYLNDIENIIRSKK